MHQSQWREAEIGEMWCLLKSPKSQAAALLRSQRRESYFLFIPERSELQWSDFNIIFQAFDTNLQGTEPLFWMRDRIWAVHAQYIQKDNWLTLPMSVWFSRRPELQSQSRKKTHSVH